MVDHVNGVNGMGGVQPIRRMKAAYRMSNVPSPADSVEIPTDVMRLSGIEGIRLDKVLAVRSQIASGTYFTPDKLDVALDRALDDALGQLFAGT